MQQLGQTYRRNGRQVDEAGASWNNGRVHLTATGILQGGISLQSFDTVGWENGRASGL